MDETWWPLPPKQRSLGTYEGGSPHLRAAQVILVLVAWSGLQLGSSAARRSIPRSLPLLL